MNTTKRLLFQAAIWLVIWLVLWSQQTWATHFIEANIFSFLAQIVLIALLIYYTAPRYLFKKKYLLFVVVSLAILALFGVLFSQLMRPMGPFATPPIDGLQRKPPPQLFTQGLLLLIAYIIATVVEFVVFTHKKEEEIIKSKNENLQTELKLLKSQINPHFLFNSLNNIYALSAIDTEKTQQSISFLSDMLRYVLYECERPFVPLQKELDYIENYIRLFSLKSSEKYPIETSFQISDSTVEIAPMLLIPFIENAFKHSNIERKKDTFIKLSVVANSKTITFKIENSVASKAIVKDDFGGIGLENVKKRLAILYPNNHSLSISEDTAVFKVDLNLEIND
tara:strand:- start:240850 stop:241863 length:1014 start_codon:yes stop_codon:yes gene_type:complete